MKSTYSRDLALYFEKLRFDRHLTQEVFVEGIVSLRQYRRYLKGDSHISQDVVNLFCERLCYPTHSLLISFENERQEEMKRVVKFYNMVAYHDDNAYISFIKEYPRKRIIDRLNLMIYDHAIIAHEYNHRKITADDYAKMTLSLIDYPAILTKLPLSTPELLILSSLLYSPSFDDRENLSKALFKLTENPNLVISGRTEIIYPLAMYRLIQYRGIQKKYADVLELCDRVIAYNQENRLFYLLDSFYYFKALAHSYLGQKDEFEEALFRTYSLLRGGSNPANIERMRKLIESDWPINFDQFAIEYIEKHFIK